MNTSRALLSLWYKIIYIFIELVLVIVPVKFVILTHTVMLTLILAYNLMRPL